MQRWNVRRERGFTLVEMMAVTIIIGVVAAIAVPNLLGLLYKARITDGVAMIEGAIKEAQRQAIRNSRSCSIQFTTNGAGRTVIQNSANQCLIENRVLPEGVEVTDDINATRTIQISSKGNIANTADYTTSGTRNFWTINVSHDVLSNSDKCVTVEGLFGDVQTGIVLNGTCTTNL